MCEQNASCKMQDAEGMSTSLKIMRHFVFDYSLILLNVKIDLSCTTNMFN